MRMLALLFAAVAALGDERVIAPPAVAFTRAMARSEARIAVAEATLGGVRAVIADFDGGAPAVVSLSSEPAHAAAAASDGRDFLITWISGGALHAVRLRGDVVEPVALESPAADDARLAAVFDGSRYLVLWDERGAYVSAGGVVEESFATGVPVSAAVVDGGRVIVAWHEVKEPLHTANVGELQPDHTIASRHAIMTAYGKPSGGIWYVRDTALASGFAAGALRDGGIDETLFGVPLAADLAPLRPQTLHPQSFSLSTAYRHVRVVPFGAGFLVIWHSGTCGCPYDGVWAAEVNSDGALLSRARLRRDGLAPAAAALPDGRAAVVYGTPAGLVLRVYEGAAGGRQRAVRR